MGMIFGGHGNRCSNDRGIFPPFLKSETVPEKKVKQSIKDSYVIKFAFSDSGAATYKEKGKSRCI